MLLKKRDLPANGCISLLVLPFLLIGMVSLYLSVSPIYFQFKARNWIPVNAQLIDVTLIKTPHGDGPGYSYETQCNYTYTYKHNTYTNQTISFGYGNNNTENHEELYDMLKYTTEVVAYINPKNPQDAILAKGINSSTISLLVFAILWNGMLGIFVARFFINHKSHIIYTWVFIFVFISGFILISSQVLHTDFEEKIKIVTQKTKEEIEQMKQQQIENAIKLFENQQP
ncbi:DUF3592 domain-containing protein [Aquimarina hainanensis]|uniref:DUF3592 domain-containing protein n=1 Tax=Aquimarina hainanensis TaxID=1578017 RepID=A0ABW5NC63_9FLAO